MQNKKKFVFAIGDSERELRILWIVLANQRNSHITFKELQRGDTARLFDRQETFVGDVSPDWTSDIRALVENYNAKVICLNDCKLFSFKYPSNVRSFQAEKVLAEYEDQHDMLTWAGFEEPILYLDLNDNMRYMGEHQVLLEDLPFDNVILCAWCDNYATAEVSAMGKRITAFVCGECAQGRDLGYFSNWKRQEDILHAKKKENRRS